MGVLAAILARSHVSPNSRQKSPVSKESLAQALQSQAPVYKFPTEMELPLDGGHKIKTVLQYAFDAKLQESMENLFKKYTPDYGAFVAMDAETGRILSLVSYTTDRNVSDNLALRSTFPSASVFKVVTAAAAIEGKKFNPETVIPFNGRPHTLYKKNILKTAINRWTSYPTLKMAFAKSINTVFGKVGVDVGHEQLRTYAERFGFNHPILADFPIGEGWASIPTTDDSWGIAEAASGYTRETTMSPLQGALIAATVANDGVMMEPYIVSAVYTEDGSTVYNAEPKVANLSVDPTTASEIRELMRQTIISGTSHKTFRGFSKGKFSGVDVGGKTGSLTGTDPAGKYDWFVGFARLGTQKIAVSALTIHKKLWRVKSSYLARQAIEQYFKAPIEQRKLASQLTTN